MHVKVQLIHSNGATCYLIAAQYVLLSLVCCFLFSHFLEIVRFLTFIASLQAEEKHSEILGRLLYAAKVVAEKEGILDGFRVVINSGPSACKFFGIPFSADYLRNLKLLEKASKPSLSLSQQVNLFIIFTYTSWVVDK